VAPLTTVDDALAQVLERASPLPAEDVRLDAAPGRVLAADAVAPVGLPLFASSAMDGYAVRSADLPGVLPVVARIAAGRPAAQPLAAGEAMGIATGGVVPDGADTVVPIEAVTVDGDRVAIPEAHATGANVRAPGRDVAAGDRVVAAGATLTPARLGALAATGLAIVSCARRPRVTVLTTGTELRAPGESLRPGEIYESNGLMLEALLSEAGADVTRLHPVTDDPVEHRAALERALDTDVLVTSGGVSVGPHDLVRETLAGLGVEEVFWGVAMRPGKPLAFATRGSTLVFGLPGNPVSALVGSLVFVRPAVRALQGDPRPGPAFRGGSLATPVERSPARDDFVRVVVREGADGTALLDPLAGQESHMIATTAGATGLARVAAGSGTLPAGARVPYLLLDDATGA
jgi:molybdopterin molybdotransferase